MKITGATLIAMGLKPGPWFVNAIMGANILKGRNATVQEIADWLREQAPVEIQMSGTPAPYSVFLEPENVIEQENLNAVRRHFDALMLVPTIKRGVIMPDACPAGSQLGTIPVGGVVATENAIHPGFHSADICCSVAVSVFERNVTVRKVLDAAQAVTHFGAGGRTDQPQSSALNDLVRGFEKNPFLSGLELVGTEHYMTQGDGNHFFYVGTMDGRTVIVTHHGSRGLGAKLYKRGMDAAKRETHKIAPEVPGHQAWITADTQSGQDYWAALQTVRSWTKMNHYGIHSAVAAMLNVKIVDRAWNEHNFVFQRSDGLFYHAKGATPVYRGLASDSGGASFIPLNMSQPILVVRNSDANNEDAMGFAPHGAGRNISRTQHIRNLKEEFAAGTDDLPEQAIKIVMDRETKGLDVRFQSGFPDVSELPSAYKDALQVRAQIKKHNLGNVAKFIHPLGSIMAGDYPFYRRDKQKWKK